MASRRRSQRHGPLCQVSLNVFVGSYKNASGRSNGGPPITPQIREERSFSFSAAMEIALKELAAECELIPIDSSVSVDNHETYEGNSLDDFCTFGNDQLPVCAYIVPEHSFHNLMYSALGVPKRSLVMTTSAFDHVEIYKRYFRYTINNNVEITAYSDIVMEYAQRPGLDREYMALLSDGRESTTANFVKSYQRSAQKYGLKLQTLTLSTEFPTNVEEVESALLQIRVKGYHTIFLNIFDTFTDLPLIASVADRLDLIGKNYFWIFSSTSMPVHFPAARPAEMRSSPIDRLLDGAGVIHVLDGFTWRGTKLGKEVLHQDAFLKTWRNQNEEFVDRINAKMAMQGRPQVFVAPTNYFQSTDPFQYTSFVYDSVMSVGRAVCRTASSLSPSNISNHDDKDWKSSAPVTELLVPEIMNRPVYEGASGRVQWTPRWTRRVDDVAFGMYNVRSRRNSNTSTNTNGHDMVLTSVRLADGGWHDVHGERFHFHGGSLKQPLPLRDLPSDAYLMTEARRLGLTLMSVGIFVCLLGDFILFLKRKDTHLQERNISLFHLFSCGNIMTLFTVCTLSFDEASGLSNISLSRLCAIAPWMFSCGFLTMYASHWLTLSGWLTCHRKNMNLFRCAPSSHYPFGILSVLFGSGILLLLALWTGMDPYSWERTIVEEDTLKSDGRCTSKDSNLFGAILWALLFAFAATVAATLYATASDRRRAHDSTDTAHSILWAVGIQIQVLLIGPIMGFALHQSSAEARYAGTVSIVLTLCIPSFLLIIVPPIHRVLTGSWGDGSFGANATQVNQDPQTLSSPRRPAQHVQSHSTANRKERSESQLLHLASSPSSSPVPLWSLQSAPTKAIGAKTRDSGTEEVRPIPLPMTIIDVYQQATSVTGEDQVQSSSISVNALRDRAPDQPEKAAQANQKPATPQPKDTRKFVAPAVSSLSAASSEVPSSSEDLSSTLDLLVEEPWQPSATKEFSTHIPRPQKARMVQALSFAHPLLKEKGNDTRATSSRHCKGVLHGNDTGAAKVSSLSCLSSSLSQPDRAKSGNTQEDQEDQMIDVFESKPNASM